MNVLAILGGRRSSGSVAAVAKEIITGAQEAGHQCKILHLPELNLADCTHCMGCRETGRCVIRDSIEQVEEAIRWSDVIIWASPVRWASVSRDMARVLERLSGYLIITRQEYTLPLTRHARGKRAILVLSGSTRWPLRWLTNSEAASQMRQTCRQSGQKVLKTFTVNRRRVRGSVPGRLLSKARKMGKSL